MAGNLERLFEKWQNSLNEAEDFIWLESTKASINLLYKGHSITIGFPTDINDIKGFTFSSKEKPIDQWISKVNSEIQNNSSINSFTDILSMSLDKYNNKNKIESDQEVLDEVEDEDSNMGDHESGNMEDIEENDFDDEEDEEIDEYEDLNDETFDGDQFQEALQTLKMKKIWAKKDQEIRAKLGERKKNDKVKTIFSSDAAFGVLTNDLFNIMQNVHSLGFSATPIEDNIYYWSVKIFDFEKDSKISQQLQQIKKEFGYDYIELQVLFTEDLYPFYPPTIKLIRPRLQVCDMRFVLNHLKEVLQKYGSLDVNNPMNATSNTGSYSTLEHSLLRLELLSDTEPRANMKYGIESTMIKPVKASPTPITNTKTPGKRDPFDKECWAKGTGYGRGSSKSGWNVDAFLAAQKERDNEIKGLLCIIQEEIEKNRPPLDVLEESCLIPFIESYCREISLLDVERHSEIWSTLFKLLNTLLDYDIYISVFCQLQFQTRSLGDYINDISKQITLFLKRINDQKDPNSKLYESIIKVNEKMNNRINQLNDELKALEQNRTKLTISETNENVEDQYIKVLKPYLFDSGNIVTNKAKTASSQKRTIRIAQEQASLIKSLPFNFDSSVFARVDEDNIDCMQVLITGPKDTPYSGGCFLFSVNFPQDFPDSPPHVLLLTTGGGTVRFNPNLYANGKVCLSLLGTWSGNAGETWNANTSTLLQVFVSIQSLILVPDPFFNEPGYESQIGSRTGKVNSLNYNQNLIPSTVDFAMIEMIKKPPPVFKDIITAHFYYQRQKIKQQCDQWIEQFKESKKDVTKFLKSVNTLTEELNKLQKPNL
ncbi:hypothetical protein DICPUDRAFT_94526 [Dictyostelium purpureum]|uniref:UBC core domain-containing protein n=1 Tax=Dictyostelium purpureum TaxID=5786 RepID=F0ZKJ6_DICPU|nr:uncharacterized protein DICPUDRAFT_94526 [Dictyostelium purpureum]EGC35514.1 hypothetical protein DICPUDRAFT_94526 [Dictyostelium purpureum]|eukprot:XP_003287940.1 hypothetical protein DICPUDRAFT_94526 [Dictyostelium purpureum]